jgi:hypothetical protein
MLGRHLAQSQPHGLFLSISSSACIYTALVVARCWSHLTQSARHLKGCFPKPELKHKSHLPPTRRLHPPSLAFLVQASRKHCSNQSTAATPSSHKHDHSRSLSPSSQLPSLSHLPFASLGRVANLTARDTPLTSARVSAHRSVFVTHAHPYSLHQATPVQRISPTPTALKHP